MSPHTLGTPLQALGDRTPALRPHLLRCGVTCPAAVGGPGLLCPITTIIRGATEAADGHKRFTVTLKLTAIPSQQARPKMCHVSGFCRITAHHFLREL